MSHPVFPRAGKGEGYMEAVWPSISRRVHGATVVKRTELSQIEAAGINLVKCHRHRSTGTPAHNDTTVVNFSDPANMCRWIKAAQRK